MLCTRNILFLRFLQQLSRFSQNSIAEQIFNSTAILGQGGAIWAREAPAGGAHTQRHATNQHNDCINWMQFCHALIAHFGKAMGM